MTHELILTSVSQGLEPDTHGYCAVARDQNIPRQIVKRLETLSEYQHLFPPDSDEVSLQPVVYSHLIFTGHDNKIWHALSRIAAAGIDYQHQPNQLAHHIVLGEDELVPEGPAWLLALPGFHLTEWLTPSVCFSIGRNIPTLTAPPSMTRRQRIARERKWVDLHKMSFVIGSEINAETYRAIHRQNEEQITMAKPPNTPCPLWRELTDDAGWGGILAETIQTGQQVLLIFQPGQNVLPLFVEALALLPPELMWKGTFSTCYFKELPEHVACQWKAVPAGSPIVEQLLKNTDQLVLDLTRLIVAAPPGAYVEFARTGLDNTLPNEFSSELFQEDDSFELNLNTDADTHSKIIVAVPPQTFKTSEEDETPMKPLRSDEVKKVIPPLPEMIPPIIVAEKIRIQPHVPAKPYNVVQSVLNMKSRGQFYILYGVTLLLILLLLLLVIDQAADFGIFRSILGTGKTEQKAVALPPTKSVRQALQIEKGKKELPATKNNPDNSVASEAEKKRQQEEEQLKAAQARKKQLQDQVNALWKETETKQKQTRTNLDDFLSEPKLPLFLSMSVPIPHEEKDTEELRLSPPETKIFSELNVLFPFGLALDLKLIPLLDIPNVLVETRKLKLTRNIDGGNNDNKEGNKENHETLNLDSETETPAEEPVADAELQIPDDRRFQWSVIAIDTETKIETPMFDLELTEQGLSVVWRREGLENQHLYETLAVSLGFLRIQTEGENIDMSLIKSIPLFAPQMQKPVVLSQTFADTEKPELIVETPFAAEPWKTFFRTTKIPFAFQLDAIVKPESEDVELPQPESSTQFRVEFRTKIDSKKTVSAGTVSVGSDTYIPVVVPFEATLELERLVWRDRFHDQIDILKKEKEVSGAHLETMKKDLETIKNEIFVSGIKGTADQRKKRNDLDGEIRELENRLKEVDNIVDNLPTAHETLLKNKQFQFEYSASLVPLPKEEKKTTRLRSEESLLLMSSKQPKPERKSEDKPKTENTEKEK